MGSHGKLVEKIYKQVQFQFTVTETHSALAYQVYASLLVECGSAIRAISFDDEYFIAAGEYWRVVLRLRHLIANIIPK